VEISSEGTSEGDVVEVDIEDELENGIGGRDGGGDMAGVDDDDLEGLRIFQGRTFSSTEILFTDFGVNDMS